MKPINKPELRILKKSNPQPPQQPKALVEPFSSDSTVAEPQPIQDEVPAPEYFYRPTPVSDYELTPSVGNSGWQVSDIWRDLRVDAFCD